MKKQVYLKKWVQNVLEIIVFLGLYFMMAVDSESILAYVVAHSLNIGVMLLATGILLKYGR